MVYSVSVGSQFSIYFRIQIHPSDIKEAETLQTKLQYLLQTPNVSYCHMKQKYSQIIIQFTWYNSYDSHIPDIYFTVLCTALRGVTP